MLCMHIIRRRHSINSHAYLYSSTSASCQLQTFCSYTFQLSNDENNKTVSRNAKKYSQNVVKASGNYIAVAHYKKSNKSWSRETMMMTIIVLIHRRRLHRARAGARDPPTIYKWLGRWDTASRKKTANKKLAKLFRPSRKRSPQRLNFLVERTRAEKVERHDNSFRVGRMPLPTFKFVPAPLFV